MGSTSPPAGVSYRVTERLAEQFHDLVVALAEAMPGCHIADVGGGANPLLPPATIEALGLRYTVLDIDPVELAKAPEPVTVGTVGAPIQVRSNPPPDTEVVQQYFTI